MLKQRNNKWNTFIFKLQNEMLSKDSLNKAISKFWKEIIINLNDNQFVSSQFLIASGDNYKSISDMQTHNKKDEK